MSKDFLLGAIGTWVQRETIMYGLLMSVALASAAPACDCDGTFASAPRICCPAKCGCGGKIVFFFNTDPLGGLTEAEVRLWQQYLALLDEGERSGVQEIWQVSDAEGRRKLLGQVTAMQPVKEKEPEPKEKSKDKEPGTKEKGKGREADGPVSASGGVVRRGR